MEKILLHKFLAICAFKNYVFCQLCIVVSPGAHPKKCTGYCTPDHVKLV